MVRWYMHGTSIHTSTKSNRWWLVLHSVKGYGVTKGVLYVEIETDNHEGDTALKSSVIISPSYVL